MTVAHAAIRLALHGGGEVLTSAAIAAFGLALAGAAYARGVWSVWRSAGPGRGVRRSNAIAFYAGLVVLAAAVIGPFDHAADEIFAAHMVQHLLLILVAAPLLVIGVPEIALAWALPPRLRGWTRPLARLRAGSTAGGLVVLLAATATLWVWHAPALYDAAVADARLHAVEHGMFVATAWLFWWSVFRLRGGRMQHGLRVLYVFAMAIQGALLGALLTFAARPLYAAHLGTAASWGLTPLEDQQIAGLIMWVPPGILYTAVAALLLVQWLRALERSHDQTEARRLTRRLPGVTRSRRASRRAAEARAEPRRFSSAGEEYFHGSRRGHGPVEVHLARRREVPKPGRSADHTGSIRRPTDG